jgi:WD40 repeat protein
MSEDGRRVLTGHPDMKTVLWDVGTGQVIHEMENQRAFVRAVAFSPDGRHGASGGFFGIQIWDLEKGELLRELAWHDENVVSLTFAPNARWLVAAGAGQLRIWDMKQQGRVSSFRPGSSEKASSFCQVTLSGDGKTLVATGWRNGGARVFDLESDTLLWELDLPADAKRKKGAERVAVSPDGRWAVTSASDRNADVWDLTTGELIATVSERQKVATIVMHPDGDRFALGCGKIGVRIWSLPECEQLATVKPEGAGMTCLDFSADGRVLLALSSGSAVAWDMERKQVRASLPHSVLKGGAMPWGALFADGRRALLPTKTGTLLWDTVTGQELARYEAGGGAPSLAVTPDGKRAFLGCWDKTVRVWDVKRGREVMSFSPHSGGIVSLGISEDGRVLAAGGCGGALEATVYRAFDWRPSQEEMQQERVDVWRARFTRHGLTP